MIGRAGCEARSRKFCNARGDVETNRAHALGQGVAQNVFIRERRQRCIEFDKRDGEPFNAASQYQSGRTDARAKLDCMLTGLSWRCCSEQHRVVAEAMAAYWLPQNDFAAQERVFADPTVRARIEEFHRQRAAGQLRTFSTREAIERLGLDPDVLLDSDPPNNG